jgi:hypothetical protein
MLWRFLEEADEAQTKTNLPVHTVGMELSLNGLSNKLIHVLGSSGNDGGM